MSICVKGDEWRDDKIQVARRCRCTTNRLPDSEWTTLERRVGLQIAKFHCAIAGNDGTENALVCAPRARNYSPRVDFLLHRQIARERLGGVKLMQSDQRVTNLTRRCGAMIGVHGAPRRERGLSDPIVSCC